MLLCVWRERGWRADEFTRCHAQTTARCQSDTVGHQCGTLLICGMDLWVRGQCSSKARIRKHLIAWLCHGITRPRGHWWGEKWHWNKELGLLYCPPLSSCPLGHIRSSQNFCWTRWKSCPRLGLWWWLKCPSPSRAVCPGHILLCRTGKLPSVWLLKSEKMAMQPFFWPIDGALQLIFCLELEFGNSFKQALSYC